MRTCSGIVPDCFRTKSGYFPDNIDYFSETNPEHPRSFPEIDGRISGTSADTNPNISGLVPEMFRTCPKHFRICFEKNPETTRSNHQADPVSVRNISRNVPQTFSWPPQGQTVKYRNRVRGLVVCEVSLSR